MNLAESRFFKVTKEEGGLVRIAMNRPDKANGMTGDFWRELPQIMTTLNRDPQVRVAIISGEGKHFTGGMDLAEFNSIAKLFEQEPGRAALAMRDLILDLQGAISSLEQARFPVIASVHGACVGAGVDLITACDLRLASSDAFFSIEEIHIGMAADVGTLQRLPKLISPAIAAELAYSGRRFDAAEARAIGLVSAVHADREELMQAADAMARSLCAKSPLALAGIKRNLIYSRDHSVADGLDYIATWNAGMLRPEDMMSAIQAKMSGKEALFRDLAG